MTYSVGTKRLQINRAMRKSSRRWGANSSIPDAVTATTTTVKTRDHLCPNWFCEERFHPFSIDSFSS